MWMSAGAGSGPSAAELERWRRRMTAPENEIPAGAAVTALLGRTADVAVGLTSVEVFSTGWRFTLAVRARTLPPRLAHGGLFELVAGAHHVGREAPDDERLLLGVGYADGRRASTLDGDGLRGPLTTPADDEALVLTGQGGGGGDRSVDQTYWVSPLPLDGPVDVVLAWPAFGIPETRTVLDGAVLRAAGGRSVVLWPQPPWAGDDEPPPPPPRPGSGWFAGPPG